MLKNLIFLMTLLLCFHSSAAEKNKALKILPLGDSITFGINYPGGYRIKLEKLLAAENIAPQFLGSQVNGPEELKSKNNEGHPGWTIDDIAQQTQSWLKEYRPDLILLMIGSNDLWVDEPSQKPNVGKALTQLEGLIHLISQESPASRVIVASVPPEPFFWNNYVIEYNSGVKDIVQKLKNQRIEFADIYSSLTLDDLDPNDGFTGDHPSKTGYEKIANTWFKVIMKKSPM
jgi:acyl-CoA thioesterase-1